MARINPEFKTKLKKYGAVDFNACYNCGTCTAICSLSTEENSFPREMLRFSSLGLEEEIKSSLKPWLCYYCGECSISCPREADPGNLMMSLRRYLISKYDWTGLSGVLFKSVWAYVIAFFIILAGIVSLYAGGIFDQEEMMHYGHLFEMLAIAGVFAVILLPNIVRMWYFAVLSKKKKFVIKHYILALKELFIHMFTQKRSLECNVDDLEVQKTNRNWWFMHLLLVIGYLTLLTTTVFFNWFGSENLFVIYFGYIVSAIVFVITFLFVMARIKKRTQKTKSSHFSDWFFVIWLFFMGLSAFFVRLFIDIDILENNFWMYLFHIMILAQWALIIVPFGKWTHFLYRSFAMYFENILAKK